MIDQTPDHEMIPESKAARWAWRVSLIPLLGVPLFILLAFLALYRIGSKCRTGFWLLRRGVVAVLLLSVVPYFGLYLSGYSGYYPKIYDNAYFFLPKHGMYNIYDIDKIIMQESWFFGMRHGRWIDLSMPNGKIFECEYKYNKRYGKFKGWLNDDGLESEGEFIDDKKVGKWIEWDLVGNKAGEGNYVNSLREGPWIEWDGFGGHQKGEYKNGKKEGKWIGWDRNDIGLYMELYNKGELVDGIMYIDGMPNPLPWLKDHQSTEESK